MNVFELFAKLSLDTSEYEEELGGAKKEAQKGGGTIRSALGTAAKVGAAALAAGASAVTAITRSAIDSYADYEQLVGGVETLFGDSAGKVIEDANNAFKTAGMSVNDYMETSIQSAASLINSLGGDQEKAAELMNLSITDMADNVNKMGTTMEAVQNAYRGFSRGNFTMLDNLALGFAGTKEGMQELLDKAQEISGIEFDIDSYSDIVQAIHIVQDEMGITGTTAEEASKTISGSIASMKSAWQNLITGVADENANMGQLIDNVVDSAETAAQNLLPRIGQTLAGIGQVITGLAPVIATAVPQLITDALPSLLIAAASLIAAVGTALINSLPQLIEVGMQLVFTLIDGIINALPDLIPAIVQVILTIVEKLTEPSTLMQLIQAAFQIIGAVAQGLINAIPELVKAAPTIMLNLIEAILRFLPQVLASGMQLMVELALGITRGAVQVLAAIGKLLTEIPRRFKERVNDARKWGRDLIGNFIQGIKDKWESLKSTIGNVARSVKNYLGFSEPEEGPLSDFHTYAPDMMALFAKGIRDNEKLVTDQLQKSFNFDSSLFSGSAATWQRGETAATPFIINLTSLVELDGEVITRKTYQYSQNEIARHGMSFVNA